MIQHWEPIVRPVLTAASPSVIAEIGARHGETTAKLLAFATGSGSVVHAIDPAPSALFDLDKMKEVHGDRFVFHHALSLDAIPQIEGIDVVLIDGDHNWYTVYNELELLSKRVAAEGRDFPVAILHDVDWPYDRRDQYCNPDAIPEQFRQPFTKGGLSPDEAAPLERRGLHADGYHALKANTTRNGVRTAVEDFLSANGQGLRFVDVIGFNGLGILVAESQLERNPELRELLEEFQSPAWLRDQCRRIEVSRVRLQIRLEETAQGGRLRRLARRLRRRFR